MLNAKAIVNVLQHVDVSYMQDVILFDVCTVLWPVAADSKSHSQAGGTAGAAWGVKDVNK